MRQVTPAEAVTMLEERNFSTKVIVAFNTEDRACMIDCVSEALKYMRNHHVKNPILAFRAAITKLTTDNTFTDKQGRIVHDILGEIEYAIHQFNTCDCADRKKFLFLRLKTYNMV